MPDLLTTDEAAAYLRLSERKLYELVANAAVPCTKLTGKWLFPKAALERWLAAGLLTPTLALAPTRPSIHRLARLARRPDGDRGLQDQRAGIVLPQCQCTGGVMLARLAVTLAAATIAVPAVASEPVLLHAAGSLRTALTEVAGAFEAGTKGTGQIRPFRHAEGRDFSWGERRGIRLSQHGAPTGVGDGGQERSRRAVRAQSAVCVGEAGACRRGGNDSRSHARRQRKTWHLHATRRSFRRLRLGGIP